MIIYPKPASVLRWLLPVSWVVVFGIFFIYIYLLQFILPTLPNIQAGSPAAIGVLGVVLGVPSIIFAMIRQITVEQHFVISYEQAAVALGDNIRSGLAANDLATRINALDQLFHIYERQPEREEQVLRALVTFLSARSPGDIERPIKYPVLLTDSSWPRSIRRDWAGWDAKRDALAPGQDVLVAYNLFTAILEKSGFKKKIVADKLKRTRFRLNSSDFRQIRANIDFSYSSLNGADFGGSSLQSSNFENCSLSDASFDAASLDECSFQDSILQGVNFIGASFIRCTFSGADLAYASLNGCDLKDCHGLSQSQINVTFGDRDTRVDPLEPPPHYKMSRNQQEVEITKNVKATTKSVDP